jgi:hypothetical protein
MTPARSSTIRGMRFQPLGSGVRPWCIGRRRAGPPAQEHAQVAAGDVGERRAWLERTVKPTGGVEGHGGLDVVDHVTDVDELVKHAR